MKLFFFKHRKLLTAAAASIALYTVIGFLIVPAILKKAATHKLAQFIGRTVTIGRIQFNPYSLAVVVRGFQVSEPKGGVILSCDAMNATIAPVSSLVHGALVFREAVLLQPRVNIDRNTGGSLTFADLFILDWPKKLHLRIDLMRLVEGTITFFDASVPGGFFTIISRLMVTVKDFSTSPDRDISYSIDAVSELGGTVSMKGLVRLDPFRSRGEIAAENLMISKYLPYFTDRLNVTITDGMLTARASYEVDLASGRLRGLVYDGSIAARSLAVNEHGSGAPVFGFSELALAGGRVDLVRRTVEADSIIITGGSAVLGRRADTTFNVQHLIKPARAPSAATAVPSPTWSFAVGEIRLVDFTAEVRDVFGRETVEWEELRFSKPAVQVNPPVVSVAAVVLREGRMIFTDPSPTPPVRMALTHVDARIGGFSSANPRLASVAISARIDDLAPLQISGETNPLGAQEETNVRVLLQNVNLVPLSPYAARYLGQELIAGELSLEIRCQIQRRKLSAQSTIEIDSLVFGGKTDGEDGARSAAGSAIDILKDPNGKITFSIPIEGTLDEPTFEFRKANVETIFDPFMQTAAFLSAALGAQLGGGGEDLGVQEFSSGSAELLPRERGKLDMIVLGMKRWPDLMLDIEGSVDLEKDAGDLQLLAADRARTVKEYLLRQGTLEPDRIFLIENSLDDVPRKGSRALLILKDKYSRPK
jgi:hypothetical protein